MGKHTSNYSVTPECVIIGLKQISKIFGFKELGENTYLRKVEGEEDICLVYANDFLTFFTDDTNITYGFISEIEITEDMYAVDIEKIMLDLKEKLPEITGWITDSLLKEREVLILAEYVPQGKILSYAEAEKIANKE